MADFQSSTHRERWMFTPQALIEKCHAANQRALRTLEKYGSTRLEVDIDGSLSYPKPQTNARENGDGRHAIPEPLNPNEEKLMRIFYEQKIQEVCGAFGFPHKIQATAIIYFKRFYLNWSVMEHDPKHIMLTCIYTSCKVEEFHVSAEELGKGIQQDHEVILNNEMIVLKSLGFDLIVYAPYRSVDGFLNDMEDFSHALDDGKLKALGEATKLEVDKTMLTDAPLLFPPGQLALAALRRSNEVHKVLDFKRYLESLCSQQNGAHTSHELTKCLSAIDSVVSTLKIPEAKDMRHVDRKLKFCRNPSLQDETKKREKKSKHKSKRTLSQMQEVPPP
ncbi:hypothetical protein AMTRI_Chr13g84760 [Amborella trichopoda]|nr:cyclin-H1-1 [Amborella trichopoda]XP_020521881.1 cyclin-H1-1 [Amborella trichopoda]XP_020521882.1 cyclin-H1-1 [Amborella trichopoda]|eukprot:XP_011622757.1 cyclin-H1-1 [Amborella trichopoda]